MAGKTPINDFIDEYCKKGGVRFHMPGHKGRILHGLEDRDITEVRGADYLFEADGIIAKSEQLTSQLFGSARTLYSTEGSSLSIKTMLAVAVLCRKDCGKRPLIIAPRNVHKAFINACCLLDIDVKWVYPNTASAELCSSFVGADDIETAVLQCGQAPDGVYITSPDYLGNIADINEISKVCRNHGIPLLVDNAHGAYLKFLKESLHPLDFGADMCCDSAHKTLPVYTGGSYLHISKNAPKVFSEAAKSAMAMFASTSPSYLIMGSLDKCCGELQGDLPQRIQKCAKTISQLAQSIKSQGWDIRCIEPLKLTIFPESMGYSGNELGDCLRERGIECEYSDYKCVVLMCSPFNSSDDFVQLKKAMAEIPKRKEHTDCSGELFMPEAVTRMSIRQAEFSPCRRIRIEDSEGEICARSAISCQPSVPVIIAGEEISADVIKILKNYSIYEIDVI